MTLYHCDETVISEFTLVASNYSKVAFCMPDDGFLNVTTGPAGGDVQWRLLEALPDGGESVYLEGGTPLESVGSCDWLPGAS